MDLTGACLEKTQTDLHIHAAAFSWDWSVTSHEVAQVAVLLCRKEGRFQFRFQARGKRYNVNIYQLPSMCSLLILVTHTHASGWLIVLCTRSSLLLHRCWRSGGWEGDGGLSSAASALLGKKHTDHASPGTPKSPLSEQHLDSILKKRKKIQRRFQWKKLGVVSG